MLCSNNRKIVVNPGKFDIFESQNPEIWSVEFVVNKFDDKNDSTHDWQYSWMFYYIDTLNFDAKWRIYIPWLESLDDTLIS